METPLRMSFDKNIDGKIDRMIEVRANRLMRRLAVWGLLKFISRNNEGYNIKMPETKRDPIETRSNQTRGNKKRRKCGESFLLKVSAGILGMMQEKLIVFQSEPVTPRPIHTH